MEKALSSETVVNGHKAPAFYALFIAWYCMHLSHMLDFQLSVCWAKHGSCRGGPGWQIHSTDATISLSLAQGMAGLSGCTGPEGYIWVVGQAHWQRGIKDCCQKGGHVGKGWGHVQSSLGFGSAMLAWRPSYYNICVQGFLRWGGNLSWKITKGTEAAQQEYSILEPNGCESWVLFYGRVGYWFFPSKAIGKIRYVHTHLGQCLP